MVDKTAKEVLQEEYSEALSANPGFLGKRVWGGRGAGVGDRVS